MLILDFKNTNCPINEVPSYMYKKIAESLSHIVFDWFHKSVIIAKLPSCLKKNTIVPVFKGGDNTVVKNYRLIFIVS